MAEERKGYSKSSRQEWTPHWTLRLLYNAWMLLFGAAKVALGAAATVLIICFVCVVVFAGILGDYLQNDIMPLAGVDLGTIVTKQNSYLYYLDNDGNIQLGRQINADSYSEWVSYEDIPKNLIHAAVAIEDKRFFEHQGVDWVTTIKACAGIFFGDDSKGGSTITQQLIKNITKENSVTVQRKVMEICSAAQCEKLYDKTVIMEWYLNSIFFGNKCDGVKTAAAKYFGKELESLTIAECASLISITNNPSLYNPYGKTFQFRDYGVLTAYERNKIRKEDTLEQMYLQEWITEEEYQQALEEVIVNKDGIDFEDSMTRCESETCDYRGLVKTFIAEGDKYFCPVCGTEMTARENDSAEVYSWFEDTVIEEVAMAFAERDGVEWNKETRELYMKILQNGGYHIYTTLDMDVQKYVDVIYQDLKQIPETRSGQQLQSAIVIVDNSTGDIVAMAGGVGEKLVYDAYNCATDAKLQTGSSIKPLTVYGPAFELGLITPASVIKDMPYEYDEEDNNKPWPRNDTRQYSYAKTILSAICSSTNAVAVNTLDIIGTGYAFDFAKDKFGITTLTREYVTSSGQIKTDENLAALGLGAQTIGISVREMTDAFAVFASNGVYRRGRTYTKVYDSEGNLILDNTQYSQEVLSENTVEYINYCLTEATRIGTGSNGYIKGMSVGSKSGTTSDAKDRWYCGYTPYYTAAVWCGYKIPEVIQLVGDWSNPAGRLFKKVMEPLHAGLPYKALYNDWKFKTIEVCLDSGMLATDACRNDVRVTEGGRFTRVEKVKVLKDDENVPTEKCTRHAPVEYCTTGQGVATEFCKHFEEEQLAVIEKKSLVVMVPDDIEELRKAEKAGLLAEYKTNNYIYLLNKNGKPGIFKGLSEDPLKQINKDIEAPYLVCPMHTQQAWEEYLAAKAPTTDPLPEDPTTEPVSPPEDVLE